MCAQIVLAGGAVATIDDVDLELVSARKWQLHKSGYACHSQQADGKSTVVYMHRIVMRAPAGYQVDHIDGNPLNNSRSNLRLCTRSQNHANKHKPRRAVSSQYKGVSLAAGKWRACIKVNQKFIHLGRFESEFDSARAYDAAARQHFGEFAKTNF